MSYVSTQEWVPAYTLRSSSGLSAELDLLLKCARTTLDSRTEESIRFLLQQQIDWAFLIRTAHQHRVLPLLYRSLMKVSPHGIPEQAMSGLRWRFQANAKRNLFLVTELLGILDLFNRHNISVVPYKGPILAIAVYGDVALRQFSDLDVIVPPNDVEKARACLSSHGYRLEKEMKDKELRAWIRTAKDLTFLCDNDRIHLELHWGITTKISPVHISSHLLWENLITLPIAGKMVQVHAPEDLLMILCIHGGKHGWEHLGWICDIAEIIRSQPLDWTRVIEIATKLRARRILFLGLVLAKDLLNAELPAEVLLEMETDRMLERLSGQVRGWLFSENSGWREPGERERYFMRLREHARERLQVALLQAGSNLAPTAHDRELFPLPGYLSWILYGIRPVRLACKYGLDPLKRFLKGMVES